LNEPIPELLRVAPGANKAISQAVMRALERNPSKRFSTCAQLAEALETAAGQNGVAAPRDVAVFVKAMLGEEIDKQRDAVRAWLASSQPSQAGLPPPPSAPSSVSAAAMAFPGEEFSRSRTNMSAAEFETPRKSRAPLVAALLLLVPLAGGAGFYFARNRASAPIAVPVPPAAPVHAAAAAPLEPAPKPSAEAAPTAVETASAAPTPEAAPAPAAPRQVRARPAPKKKEESGGGEDLDVRNPYR
jgi:hypothetical protein